MKITSKGVLLTSIATGAVVAVEGGKVYDSATRIDITGTALANSAIKHLKRMKEVRRDQIADLKRDGRYYQVQEAELKALRKALYNVNDRRRLS